MLPGTSLALASSTAAVSNACPVPSCGLDSRSGPFVLPETSMADEHGESKPQAGEDSKPTDAAMATSGPADQVAAGGPDLNGTGEGQNQHGADNILAGTPRGEPGMDDRREADTALARNPKLSGAVKLALRRPTSFQLKAPWG